MSGKPDYLAYLASPRWRELSEETKRLADYRCQVCYNSNPGETVLTPFMGIGSEAYQAVRFGRRAIGIELKESYFNIAAKNLRDVEMKYKSIDLFASLEKATV